MTRFGFIGLGTMGSRIAENVLRAAGALIVHDASEAATVAFAAKGARAARTPREVAENADVIFLSLPDSPEVLEVATGPDGIGAGGAEGLAVIDLSTVAPMTPRRLAAEFSARGMAWLDAPVSGGPSGAAAGTLTIMVGGDQAAFDRCRPFFDMIGKNIRYMGASGTGATTKVVNQLAVGIETMAMFEAFTLGVAAGIDAKRLHEVLRTSSSGCWAMENLAPAVLLANRSREEPAAWFALRLQHKDMRIAVETASALNVPLAAGALSAQLYAIAEGQGWGNQDQVSAVNLYADYVGIERW
ncbi:MAG TPA: NAD(P)-dependent oxidoreductase [Dongiaceae bacterium]|nr:NAD(P)-dependent oxidoreductase [Dongiaceae bacterium]